MVFVKTGLTGLIFVNPRVTNEIRQCVVLLSQAVLPPCHVSSQSVQGSEPHAVVYNNISQGTAVTCLKCGDIFNYHFTVVNSPASGH